MEGIVSLLDEEHSRLAAGIWSELEAEFGLRGVLVTPFPHFSYHVAQSYDSERLGSILEELAGQTKAFTIQTSGLGIFTGDQPVVYIPVIRTQALSRLHAQVWARVAPIASGTVDYYRPEAWLPHITLALTDLDCENLPRLIRFLSPRALNWEVVIDNLSFIEATDQGNQVRFCCRFGRGRR